MSRRNHTSSNGEFENYDYNADSSQQGNYEYYSSENYSQGTYECQSNNNFAYNTTVDNAYNSTEGTNASSHYEHGGQIDSFKHEINNQYYTSPSVNPIPQVSFPTVKSSPVVQQSGAPEFGSQCNYRANIDKSWLSAFSSGGFDNELPLLEGISLI